MAHPDPYSRGYGFAPAVRPTNAPEAGARIDGELDRLSVFSTQVRSSLSAIQRSDGGLANRVVGYSSLANPVRALMGNFNPRGAWAPATSYAVRDLITTPTGRTDICIVAHTSSVYATDAAASRWMPLFDSANLLSTSEVQADGASATRTLGSILADELDVISFGADPTGVADSTAAINAALAEGATTGAPVFIPAGDYKITGPIVMDTSGQRIRGASWTATRLVCAAGSYNVFYLLGPARELMISDLSVVADNLTGGYVFYVDGADRVLIERIFVEDPYNLAYVYHCNGLTFRDIYAEIVRGLYGFHLFGDSTHRSDVLRFENCNLGGTLGSRTWTGLYWDGHCNTVVVRSCTFVAPLRGVLVTDSVSDGALPTFGRFFDLEVDFPLEEGILIEAGINFEFSQAYTGGSANTCSVKIGASVADVQFFGGYCRGSLKEGFVIEGVDVRVIGMSIVFNSYPDLGTYDAVRITGTAKNVIISTNQIGSPSGAGSTARYGVSVENGARSVRITSNDFYGCYLDDVLDNAGTGIPGNVEVESNGNRDYYTNDRPAGFEIGVRDGTGALLTPTISAGQITAVSVADGGANYLSAPAVFALDPAGTGTGFTATASVSGGVVSSITVTNQGSGYSAGTKAVIRSATRVPTIRARYPGLPNVGMRVEADGSGAVSVGNEQGLGLDVFADATSVNRLAVVGRAAGGTPALFAAGADTNITMGYTAKGTGGHLFASGSGTAFSVAGDVASSVNYVRVTGAATGSHPAVNAAGSDTNIDLQLLPKGSGLLQLGGPTTGSAGSVSLYLSVVYAGTTYKIPLHAVS